MSLLRKATSVLLEKGTSSASRHPSTSCQRRSITSLRWPPRPKRPCRLARWSPGRAWPGLPEGDRNGYRRRSCPTLPENPRRRSHGAHAPESPFNHYSTGALVRSAGRGLEPRRSTPRFAGQTQYASGLVLCVYCNDTATGRGPINAVTLVLWHDARLGYALLAKGLYRRRSASR